jgi:hypothetical protein
MLVPPSGLAQVGVLDSRTFCAPMEVHGGAPVEEPCLNELKEVAKREGSVLTLKLGNGKTKIISDSKECDDPNQEGLCISYRLVGYVGDKQFIVAVVPYECGSVLLVNRRSGKETALLADFVTEQEAPCTHIFQRGRRMQSCLCRCYFFTGRRFGAARMAVRAAG